jgi:hypothetical protein
MKKNCPNCNNKAILTLLKNAKSFLVGNQYQCSNCQAVLAWDRLSHILSFLFPVLLIIPILLIEFITLSNQQVFNIYIGFGFISLLLLIFGFYRRYLVVYKS